MSTDGAAMSSAFISGKDGATIVEALEKGYEVKIKIYKEDATIDNSTAGQMSSFTSWGSGQALELKPEITAPGGNIWSTVAGGSNTGGEVYTEACYDEWDFYGNSSYEWYWTFSS